MGKPLLAGLFWWLATSYALEFAAGMYGISHGFGPLLGFLIVGTLMVLGARGTIWAKAPPHRRIARIPDPRPLVDGRRAVSPNG